MPLPTSNESFFSVKYGWLRIFEIHVGFYIIVGQNDKLIKTDKERFFQKYKVELVKDMFF